MSWSPTKSQLFALALVLTATLVAIFLFVAPSFTGDSELEASVGEFTKIHIKLDRNERYLQEEDISSVDTANKYVNSDVGYVIDKPYSDAWTLEEIEFSQLARERRLDETLRQQGFSDGEIGELFDVYDATLDVRRIRTGTPADWETTSTSKLGELPVPPGLGERTFDQVVIMAYRKSELLVDAPNLLTFFLGNTFVTPLLGPKRLAVDPANSTFVLDLSVRISDIEVNGVKGTHWMTNALVFQENDDYYLMVTVNDLSDSSQDPEIAKALESYLASFRVLD